MGRLQGRFRKQDAVVGDDADWNAENAGEAADDSFPVAALELVEFGAVGDAGDDLAHVEWHAPVGRDKTVEVQGVVQGIRRFADIQPHVLDPVQVADGAPGQLERVVIVVGDVVGDAGNPRMHVGAAELLGRYLLAGRRLDQRRPAQKDRALALDDDAFIRHCRHVGPAGRARTHDHGDLRNAGRRHPRLVVEDAAEMVAVGKDLVLGRQEGAAGIDQIHARQVVFLGNFLGPQVFLDGDRVIRPALHRGVVGQHHHFGAADAPEAGDDAARRHVVFVELMPGQGGEFQKRRIVVQQPLDAVPRQQLAAPGMFFPRRRAAAFLDLG